MKQGNKACRFCGTRYEFADYELVDCVPAETTCLGTERLLTILERSKLLKAAKPEQPEPADLSASANLARLLAGRRTPEAEPVDFKIAQGGKDE